MTPSTTTLERHGMTFTARVHDPAGRANGETVVMLHGFPDTNATFDPLAERLTGAGFRIVCPMLRGYERDSIAPDGDYRLPALAGDVVAWLDHLGLDQVHLYGHDWGACVAYVTALLHPDRLRTVTASSVPPLAEYWRALRRVPRQFGYLWYQALFQVRGAAEWLVRRDHGAFVELLWRRWSPGWDVPAEHVAAVRRALSDPAVARAVLTYYRQQFDPGAVKTTWRIDVPALVLSGTNDRCLLPDTYPYAVDNGGFAAGVRLEVLDGVGHWPHLERPDAVAALLGDHLTTTKASP